MNAKHAAMMAALEGLSSRARRSSLDGKLPEDKRGGLTIIIAAPDDKGDPGAKPPGGPVAPSGDDSRPVGRLGEGSRWRQRTDEDDADPLVVEDDVEDDDDDM